MILKKKAKLAFLLLFSMRTSHVISMQETLPQTSTIKIELKFEQGEDKSGALETIFNGKGRFSSKINDATAMRTYTTDVLISIGNCGTTLYHNKALRLADIYLLGVFNRTYTVHSRNKFSLDTDAQNILTSMITDEERTNIDQTIEILSAPWIKKINEKINSNSGQLAINSAKNKHLTAKTCIVS